MPGYFTHYLFGSQAMDMPKLKHNSTSLHSLYNMYPNVFSIGAQGPDVFFYHLSCNLNPHKKLGTIMHKEKAGAFFRTCLDYLEQSSSRPANDVFISYLAGMICHYTLDCCTHPFIYNRTNFDFKRTDHKNYLVEHCQYESNIDSLLLQDAYHCLPSQYAADKHIRLTRKEIALLAAPLSNTIVTTYFDGRQSYATPGFMKTALRFMHHEVHFLTDRGGVKRKLVEWLEKKTVGAHILTCLFTLDRPTSSHDFLNKAHEEWHSPWEPDTIRTESFLDLYQDALDIAAHRLSLLSNYYDCLLNSKDCSDMIQQQKELLLNELGDSSYNSGLNWRLAP